MSLSIDDVVVGEYYVLTPSGDIYYPEEYETSDESFKALIEKEALKLSRQRGISPHVKYLKKLRIAEYEPYSDAGHLTFLPRGVLIADLLMDYALNIVRKLGAYPVRSSIMYDLSEKAIREHANLFGQRMYKVKPGEREFVLRYAACFGQFAMLKRHYITIKDLPLRVFEIADSYRYEQRGELSGLSRIRRFYMPDLHILTKEMDEALKEFIDIFKLIMSEGERFGWKYYNLYNITDDFLKSYMDFILNLVRIEDKPVLVYVVDSGKYYWKINIEFHYIDSQMRPIETATVQIDVGNAKRFDIKYYDESGSTRYPIILHVAIHGSIERFMFEFLEEAAKMEANGLKPMLPVWLSPIQVRIVPISREYIDYSLNIMAMIRGAGIRVDIDDRDISTSRRVLHAEREWIPYIVVIGGNEVKGNYLNVRIRSEGGKSIKMGLKEFIDRVKSEIDGYPFRDIYFSEYVSRRPSFV